MERYFLPYLKVKGADAAIPVVVGVPVKTTLSIASNKDECEELMRQFENKNYMVTCCHYVLSFPKLIIRNKVFLDPLSIMKNGPNSLLVYPYVIMLGKDTC